MRFLIVGAGGIGCYYGAKLLKAGHDCTFVARGPHLEAMRKSGLHVVHTDFEFLAPVDVTDLSSLINDRMASEFDLIMLTLKSGATDGILTQLDTWLSHANTPILSLQNGVDNESRIAQSVGNCRTFGGLAVRIGGHIQRPGIIEATGPAQIIFGPWPNSKMTPDSQSFAQILESCFEQAGIPTHVSDDIRRELWRKLLINNGVNPLSALTGLDTRSLTSDPALGNSVYSMMQETACAARADDVELTQADIDEMFTLISQFDAIKTSMLVDREKGRPLELDSISGAVIRRCVQLQLNAPITSLVTRLLEMDVASPSLYNLNGQNADDDT
ncbi:2-dehydropantoate 2-reductase [Marinobacterium lacunae]|uniref:2-dehydropantoate 2-reductase n=1 Tax=Marinobacterium lacunae TaxID=1232683 RepID=A0A081G4K9_9GAMM|nr:2-dehydropantoate 2-reductase [Marinobacterium lacunae]KEA65714.1 2-dehydropantoate 2-reductase [Marinobacterium lacunae]